MITNTAHGRAKRAAPAMVALAISALAGTGCGIQPGQLHADTETTGPANAARIAGNAPLYTGSVAVPARTKLADPMTQQRRFLGVVVNETDTLPRIALRYKVPVSSIMTANKLQDQHVKPGQFLIIPLYL